MLFKDVCRVDLTVTKDGDLIFYLKFNFEEKK